MKLKHAALSLGLVMSAALSGQAHASIACVDEAGGTYLTKFEANRTRLVCQNGRCASAAIEVSSAEYMGSPKELGGRDMVSLASGLQLATGISDDEASAAPVFLEKLGQGSVLFACTQELTTEAVDKIKGRLTQ